MRSLSCLGRSYAIPKSWVFQHCSICDAILLAVCKSFESIDWQPGEFGLVICTAILILPMTRCLQGTHAGRHCPRLRVHPLVNFAWDTTASEEHHRNVMLHQLNSPWWRADLSGDGAAAYDASRPPIVALNLGPHDLPWLECALWKQVACIWSRDIASTMLHCLLRFTVVIYKAHVK